MNYDTCEPGLNLIRYRAIENSAELTDMNDGDSLGWDSEERLEKNSKDIRIYHKCLNGKCDRESQTEDVQF